MQTDPLKNNTSRENAVCADCGAPIPGHARFCRKCGAEIPAPSRHEDRVCPNCGAALPEEADFCRRCGSKAEIPASPENVPSVEPEKEIPSEVPAAALSGAPEKEISAETPAAEAAAPDAEKAPAAEKEPASGKKKKRKKKVITNCPKCGEKVEPGMKKCPKCGRKLKKRHGCLITLAVLLVLILVVPYAGIRIYFAVQNTPHQESVDPNDIRFHDWNAEGVALNPEPIVFGDLEAEGYCIEIPAGALPADLEIEAGSHSSTYIRVVGYEDCIFFLEKPVKYSFRLNEIPTEEEAPYYLCKYYEEDIGVQYITPDWDRLLEGYMEFETYHFSDYEPKKLEVDEFVAAKAKEAAANTYLHIPMNHNGAAILSAETQQMATDFGKAIGLEREDSIQLFKEVITSLSSTAEEISGLQEAAEDQDKLRTLLFTKMADKVVGICQKEYREMESLGIARANAAHNMMDMHPEDASSWKTKRQMYDDLASDSTKMLAVLDKLDVAEKLAVLSEMAGTAYGYAESGAYMKAVEEVTKTLLREFSTTFQTVEKVAGLTTEIYMSGVDVYVKDTMETQYKAFKESEIQYSDDQWNNVFEGYNTWFGRGAYPTLLRRVRENYCKSAGITMEELEKDRSKMWNKLDEDLRAKIKANFEERKKREDEIETLSERYELFLTIAAEYNAFEKYDDDYYNRSFGHPKNVDDRIRLLCNARKNVLEMTGGNLRRFGKTPEDQEKWLVIYAKKWLNAPDQMTGKLNVIRELIKMGHVKPSDEVYKEYVKSELESLLGVYHGNMKFQKASYSQILYDQQIKDDPDLDMSKAECDALINYSILAGNPRYRRFTIEEKNLDEGTVWIGVDLSSSDSYARFYVEAKYEKGWLIMDTEYGRAGIKVKHEKDGTIHLKARKVPFAMYLDPNEDEVSTLLGLKNATPSMFVFTNVNVEKESSYVSVF